MGKLTADTAIPLSTRSLPANHAADEGRQAAGTATGWKGSEKFKQQRVTGMVFPF